MENVEQTTDQTTEQKQPELTLVDLANIRSIVDAAVRRGVFNASEISAVGAAYDKLNTFLNAVQAQAPAGDEQAPAVE